MKKFLIFLFFYCSFFLVLCTILRHIQNKPPLTFSLVLNEFQNNKITFDINNDIKEVTTSFNDLGKNSTFGGGDVLEAIVNGFKMIYYGFRFLIKFVIHSLSAILNVIILVLRLAGFSINYVTLSFGSNTGDLTDSYGQVIRGISYSLS